MKKHRITSPVRFIAFLVVLIIASIWLIGTLFGYFDASSSAEPVMTEYRVQNGDTLWGVAGLVQNERKDRRQIIYEICKINDITVDTFYAGTTILVPYALGE